MEIAIIILGALVVFLWIAKDIRDAVRNDATPKASGVELIKVMLDDGARMPTRAHADDAGLDLYVKSREYDYINAVWVYHTGVHVAIPKGYFGALFSRSSIAKYDLVQTNGVGVIDNNYRGELMVKFTRREKGARLYEVGDKFAQLVILPYEAPTPVVVSELDDTDRGSNGYGSTLNK